MEPADAPILPSKDAAEPKRGRAFSVFALMLGATAVAAVVRSTTVLSAVSTDAELAVNGRGLYHCKNGYPDVPKAYDRDWGDLTGDWYVVMQNPADQAREFKCDRMVFDMLKDDARLRQSMLYERKGTDYYWNVTQAEYKDRTGVWKDTENQFWSSVYAVGTEDDGSRWVGWYFCGPAVAATKKGISYILKDSTDGLTKSFYKKARKAANAAGVNDYGKMVEVDIEDSCDYTFPTAGV
jgi:hypothetical protein|tara:strand:- start:95 stop:808 length:714 start_codon:yes stop_codon:yes gene_type:complete